MSVPFEERGGPLRGLLDLACGRYPRFVVGGRVAADVLPVFHFHDVTAADLEPKLRFLAENGYRTTTADEIAAHARGDIRVNSPGGARVGLCFDDAWASVWTVAAPLLKQYGLTAITYAIPARITDAAASRPVVHEAGVFHDAGVVNQAAGPPFVTWPELRDLHASGIIDVQCHTESHSMVFCSTEATGFVTPDYAAIPMLNRPQLSPIPALRFLEPDQLGAPLYVARSRMSDARRVPVPLDTQARCVEYVAKQGGAGFFSQLDWKDRLRRITRNGTRASAESVESEADRDRAIEAELDRGRAILNERLRTNTVNHVCLPWGVSSAFTASALSRLGYRSAIANRMQGMLAVKAGDDPYWLKRLPNRYIFHLPGRGRRIWS